MTISEIIDLANSLTERKSEKVISMPQLFTHVLQEFCGESRFWWRKKTFTFNTVASTGTYDLTSITTTPSLSGIAVEEITKVTYVRAYNDLAELYPIYDDETYIEIAEDNVTKDVPGRYLMEANNNQVLRIAPLPAAIYKIRVTYWAMPNPATDGLLALASVPIVPPWFHRAIVHGMEYYIWRSIYGGSDDRTRTALMAYQKVVAYAQSRRRFSTNFSEQFISSEAGVQSTGNTVSG